jgi:hypothetical protein
MTVTLTRKPFTLEQRAAIKAAVLTGAALTTYDDPEITEQITVIAESLPGLLKKARMADSSENRSKLLDQMLSFTRSNKRRNGWYRVVR